MFYVPLLARTLRRKVRESKHISSRMVRPVGSNRRNVNPGVIAVVVVVVVVAVVRFGRVVDRDRFPDDISTLLVFCCCCCCFFEERVLGVFASVPSVPKALSVSVCAMCGVYTRMPPPPGPSFNFTSPVRPRMWRAKLGFGMHLLCRFRHRRRNISSSHPIPTGREKVN